MVHIINTNDKRNQINGKSDTNWRQAKSRIVPDINQDSQTPQSEIDAIAAAMDKQDQSNQDYQIPDHNINPSKEDIAKTMIDQYIKQNGGTIMPDNRIKKNQVIID
jgi:hypothetical protein